ncbi:Growth arrest-specific protein 7 [Acipenser ruthenus]|uniref:Growth arrest-specific protein 7 n=1 Tax=Acipenser ruthenus TaxID=7906 RepID=A0A444U8N7_ACIRT|nr:Growth arrest-specific protein 7 [Acipenser ruthenus]
MQWRLIPPEEGTVPGMEHPPLALSSHIETAQTKGTVNFNTQVVTNEMIKQHCLKPVSVSPLPEDEPGNSPLPEGWQSYMSPQGRQYYVNTFTKETTWERPTNSPGTPKSPLSQKNSIPTVNGYHTSGSPLHQPDQPHPSLRKPSSDLQSPGSTSPSRKQIKETTITINCVTFPHPNTMPEQELLKPGEWSYCDYFWDDKKDPQGNTSVTGFEVLLQKQLKGKQMQKEMAEFIRERIKIEEEYAKSLSKLSQISLAAQEEGTLGEAWAQLKKSLADEAEVHLKFSSKLQSEVEKPLLTFRDNFKKDMKKFDHHITDLRKQLASRYAAVEKLQSEVEKPLLTFRDNFKKDMKKFDHHITDLRKQLASRYAAVEKLQSEVEKPLLTFRDNFKKDMKKFDHHITDLRKQLASRYAAVEKLQVVIYSFCKARKALTDRQKDLEMKTQQLEIKLSNKTEEDIKKARRKSTQAGDELMRCVDLYNQAQSKWFEEMVTTTLELERLEVERVEMIRQHLCQYTQLRHETDMFNQSTVETVDQLLQKVEPAKDRELWVKEHKTGDIRPVDMDI